MSKEENSFPIDKAPDARLVDGGLLSTGSWPPVTGGRSLAGKPTTDGSDVDLGGGTGRATTYGAHF